MSRANRRDSNSCYCEAKTFVIFLRTNVRDIFSIRRALRHLCIGATRDPRNVLHRMVTRVHRVLKHRTGCPYSNLCKRNELKCHNTKFIRQLGEPTCVRRTCMYHYDGNIELHKSLRRRLVKDRRKVGVPSLRSGSQTGGHDSLHMNTTR